VDLTAYRVVQESLTNVRKHAGTSEATVRLVYRRDELCIEVEDDGPGALGASRSSAGGEYGGGTGHGLIGMRERAASVGGRFRAGPGPDGGFRVRVDLPLPRVVAPRRVRATTLGSATTGAV
jgi:signal transduction histidine kinase